MSLLKRLNAENMLSAPAGQQARPGSTPGSTTSSLGTGELFAMPTAPIASAGSTSDLFAPSPKGTIAISEQTPAVPQQRGKPPADDHVVG